MKNQKRTLIYRDAAGDADSDAPRRSRLTRSADVRRVRFRQVTATRGFVELTVGARPHRGGWHATVNAMCPSGGVGSDFHVELFRTHALLTRYHHELPAVLRKRTRVFVSNGGRTFRIPVRGISYPWGPTSYSVASASASAGGHFAEDGVRMDGPRLTWTR